MAWRGYVESSLRASPSIDGLQAHAMATRVGVETFLRLLAQAPGGQVASWTKVFEGKVQVFYPAQSGRVVSSWMVEAGQRIHVNRGEASTVVAMVPADYARWSEIPDSELHATTPATRPTAQNAPTVPAPVPPSATGKPSESGRPTVDLLDQSMGY